MAIGLVTLYRTFISTIFGGVCNDGMDVICVASAPIKRFNRIHDKARETREFINEGEADDERRRAVKMA